MRVALYARVSSESQAARGTIGSQLEVLVARTTAAGHEIVATYADEGYSGARLDRPGLDALRDAAEGGAFEAVWCLSPDRLARSFPYQVLIIDELTRLGVPMVFTDSPPIDDDPQARLLIQMQGVISEYERAKIAERYRRGKLYRVRAGEAIFWKVPYGYRRVARSDAGPARLEVYEPEAVVVRRIFAEYTSGTSLRQIIRHLYEDGVPTPTGKALWASSTINGLINNPTFAGKAAWYRHEYVPAPGGRTSRRARPEQEWVHVAVPAIVSDEFFAAAQAAARDNSVFSPRKTTPGLWLLRGLVVCGRCGVKAYVQPMPSSNGKTNRYYCCSNHDPIKAGGQDKRCTERRIRADELDVFVFDQIRAVLTRPDVLVAGESALAGRDAPSDDDILIAQLAKLTRRVDAADAERRRIADLYQADLITAAELSRRAKEVAARRAKLEAEHAELTARHHDLAGRNRLRQRLGDFAATSAAGLDRLDFDGRQRLIRLVVEQVRVTGWQVEIRLRIPLDGGPTDGDRRPSPKPNKPSPTTNSPRPPRSRTTVSSELGLRSAGVHQPPPVSGLPAQRGASPGHRDQRRRGDRLVGPLAELGVALPDPRVRRAGPQNPPPPGRDRRSVALEDLQRPHRVDQHQDQGPDPGRVRVPLPRRAHRHGHARRGRMLPRPAGPGYPDRLRAHRRLSPPTPRHRSRRAPTRATTANGRGDAARTKGEGATPRMLERGCGTGGGIPSAISMASHGDSRDVKGTLRDSGAVHAAGDDHSDRHRRTGGASVSSLFAP